MQSSVAATVDFGNDQDSDTMSWSFTSLHNFSNVELVNFDPLTDTLYLPNVGDWTLSGTEVATLQYNSINRIYFEDWTYDDLSQINWQNALFEFV